jgi:hypothetical protein
MTLLRPPQFLSCTQRAFSTARKKWSIKDTPDKWRHVPVDALNYKRLCVMFGKPERGSDESAIWFFLIPAEPRGFIPVQLRNIWDIKRSSLTKWIFSSPAEFGDECSKEFMRLF